MEAPKEEFTKVLDKQMCKNYNQLSTQSSSVETCSELVKAKKECKSGYGHFFYGEVNPNHKECACCVGMGEKLEADKTRASPHFNVYKLNEEKVTTDTKKKDENDDDDTDENFKLGFKYRECGRQGRNFGPLKTPEACGMVAMEAKCESFMFSHKYPVWGCRCCAKPEGGRPHKLWNVYTVDAEMSRTKEIYYKQKARLNAVKEIIEKGKDQIIEDELKTNVVKLETKDTSSILAAIKKYRYYRPTKRVAPTPVAVKPT